MGKIIDLTPLLSKIDALRIDVLALQRDEGTVPPPIPPPIVYTCPIDELTFSTQALLDAHTASAHPAPTGQFTAAIKEANLCNQPIMNPNGTRTSYGYGFYNQLNPPGVYIRQGSIVYFLIDSAWMSSFGTAKVRWILYDQLLADFKMNIYAVDTSDNGKLLLATEIVSNVFSIAKKTGIRYLFEVDATSASDNFDFTIYWP